jgi:hypothetical protein
MTRNSLRASADPLADLRVGIRPQKFFFTRRPEPALGMTRQMSAPSPVGRHLRFPLCGSWALCCLPHRLNDVLGDDR